ETYMSNVKGAYFDAGGYDLTSEYAPHRDDTHSAQPCASMCLHAEEVSRNGGETIFVNSELALDGLAASTRARIGGLRAIHLGPPPRTDPTFDPAQLSRGFGATAGAPERGPHQVWPVVLEHPVTRRAVLYIDPATFYGFEELTDVESAELADELLA